MKTLTIILCLALAQCGLSPAWAQTVEVPDVAPDYAEGGPEDMEFVTANAGCDLAMLYQVPTSPREEGFEASPAAPLPPLTIQSASGAETRVGVDVAAAERASEGWPWYGKAALVVGCVAVAALATWAVIEATNDGSHDHDSSEHLSVGVHGEGNTVNIRYGSNENTGAGSYR